MLKTSQFRIILLAGLLISLAFTGCASIEKFVSRRGVSKPVVYKKLVSKELLEAGNMEIVWENKLPMWKSETLERLFLLGNHVYALSGRNFMVSVNKENGKVIFSRSVAPVGLPVLGLELYNNELLSIIGGNLVEMNPESGADTSVNRLGFAVVCPAAWNSSYFYLAGADKRVHVLRAEDKVKMFEVAADNESAIVSVVADENFVVFATKAGNIISIMPDEPRQLWKFDAADSIVGPIVRDAGSLFFASKDTNLYMINIYTGKLVWKYQAAAVLDKAPRVAREAVYQYVRGKGLDAIDKKTGKLLWRLPEGIDLLAESGTKTYVMTNIGTMVAMDNKKAEQIYSVNLAGVSVYIANVTDSKIYIADEFGRIACIKPRE